jgi:hypothetical protein
LRYNDPPPPPTLGADFATLQLSQLLATGIYHRHYS